MKRRHRIAIVILFASLDFLIAAPHTGATEFLFIASKVFLWVGGAMLILD